FTDRVVYKSSFVKLFACNVFALSLGAIMTISIGNSNINLHHELAIQSAIKQGKWECAEKVGRNSLEATQALTALRSFAFSKAGTLSNIMFNYPQEYGSNGLIMDQLSPNTIYYTADSVYNYLGAQPLAEESTAHYLSRIYKSGEGTDAVQDYYLCSLLLDKELDQFAEEIKTATFNEGVLPRYYQEAVLLCKLRDTTYVCPTINSELEGRLEHFLARKREFASPVEEKNRMRREFGDSYWWYFFYK
ncbi:MAG: DUF6057 family protein, partial [Phocaeicola sp.]